MTRLSLCMANPSVSVPVFLPLGKRRNSGVNTLPKDIHVAELRFKPKTGSNDLAMCSRDGLMECWGKGEIMGFGYGTDSVGCGTQTHQSRGFLWQNLAVRMCVYGGC